MLHEDIFLMIIALFFGLLSQINGYPITRETDPKPEEMTFPNGTVMGKYAYVDKEGNPVQVKYYADESSYGIEMNSVKVLPVNKELTEAKEQTGVPLITDVQILKEPEPSQLPKAANTFDFVNTYQYPTATMGDVYEPQQKEKNIYLRKDSKKRYKGKYKNPDFEVYVKNDLLDASGCNADKEKLHVYNYNSDPNRKIRSADVDEEEPEFCQVF